MIHDRETLFTEEINDYLTDLSHPIIIRSVKHTRQRKRRSRGNKSPAFRIAMLRLNLTPADVAEKCGLRAGEIIT